MTATILLFPTRPAALRTIRLCHLDGRLFASAGFLAGDPSAGWTWIAETVAAELGCFPEDVHCMESEGEGDLITADGIPAYMVVL